MQRTKFGHQLISNRNICNFFGEICMTHTWRDIFRFHFNHNAQIYDAFFYSTHKKQCVYQRILRYIN